VEVTAGAPTELTVTAFALPGVAEDDPDQTNNLATAVTEVLERFPLEADLSVEITEHADPVLVGASATYTVTIHNHGPDPAENVMASLQPRASGGQSVPITVELTASQGTIVLGLKAVKSVGVVL